jgi:arylsulfatase A-like enzyme
MRIPGLAQGKRPNFIVVLTDDQGFDDIGLHQPQQPGGRPQWVSTPNLDKFLQQSMEFRNFYVSPMCSQSRAELLTGRSYQRTGTMLINGGASVLTHGGRGLGSVAVGAAGVAAEGPEAASRCWHCKVRVVMAARC